MDNKSIILAIILFAILVEGTVEYIKLSLQKQICAEIIGAFIFSLIITIGYKLDFFEAWLGLEPIIPYLGNVLTALVISRGSNYVFDLIGKFTEAKDWVDGEVVDDYVAPTNVVNHEMDEGVG